MLHPNGSRSKAWSQNLGHANVLTTLQGYGHVSIERQSEILAQLPRFGEPRPSKAEGAVEVLAKLTAIVEQYGAGSRPASLTGLEGNEAQE